jgi:hypothetical protein
MNLTRQQRRRLRKNAAATARAIAATTMHRRSDGRLEYVTDPTALVALERGFAALLKNSCCPVVQEITAEEGALLRSPTHAPPPPLPGVRHWIACGLDVDTRGTFATCWTVIDGAPEAEVVAEAERIVLEQLAEACNVSGLPMEGAV